MNDGDEDDDDIINVVPDNGKLIPPAIITTGCQFYNEISHRVRPNAGLHDIQQGYITSALSGSYTQGPPTDLSVDDIWEHQEPLLKLKKKPSPQMMEICVMLERALVYAHTGNAKQGGPTMAPTIHLTASTTIPVSLQSELRLSPIDWLISRQAYKAEFHIQLSVNNPSPTAFIQYDQDLCHAIIIAVITLQSFIGDTKTLVSITITKVCADLDNQDTHAACLKARTHCLNLKK
ncbi:hypothetical protein BDR03DRAFT_1013553 [Suillus americanus]|nr:hypothetical protein BDR03DRAFT_1013553 [Suillus americanus]